MPEELPVITPFYVSGEWRTRPETRHVHSPFDGHVVGTHAVPSADDLEEALEAAVQAHRHASPPRYERSGWLTRAAEAVEADAEHLAQVVVAESAKPLQGARAEVARLASTLRWSAEEARRLDGELLPLDTVHAYGTRAGLVTRVPVGPVLGITPFNYPLNLVAHKIGPALAVGCPIIIKPASSTPLSALALAEILHDAGAPRGFLSMLPVGGAGIDPLVRDRRVAKVSFTGSPEVGWSLRQRAPRARVTLELGGNAAAVIGDTADLELAAERITWGAFNQAGQSCISAQRVYADHRVFADLVDRLVSGAEQLVVGDPADERTDVGPLINAAATNRVETWVDEAVAAGARVLTGGKRDDPFYLPTIITDVDRAMKVSCEEVFGPVLVVQPVRTFEEALAVVNDSRFGLQAAVFTSRLDEAFGAFQRLEVGGVIVNDIVSWRADEMPYGGLKESGSGREGIRYAMQEMSEPRLLVLNGVRW